MIAEIQKRLRIQPALDAVLPLDPRDDAESPPLALEALYNRFYDELGYRNQVDGGQDPLDPVATRFIVSLAIYERAEVVVNAFVQADRDHGGRRNEGTDRLLGPALLAEYILACFYISTSIHTNPFLVHFARIYCTVRPLRYFLFRFFRRGIMPYSRKTPPFPCRELTVAEAVELCRTNSVDMYGNEGSTASGTTLLGLSVITRTFFKHGMSYSEALAALRPAMDRFDEVNEVEVLQCLAGLLKEETERKPDVPNKHQHLAREAHELTHWFGLAMARHNSAITTDQYKRAVHLLFAPGAEFSRLRSTVLLQIWRAILANMPRTSEIQQLVMAAVLSGGGEPLAPVTNQTAEFAFQMILDTVQVVPASEQDQRDLAGWDEARGESSQTRARHLTGLVFGRWINQIQAAAAAYRTGTLSGDIEKQLRLVVLALRTLTARGVLGPGGPELSPLYGQLLPFVGLVPEIGDLYFGGHHQQQHQQQNPVPEQRQVVPERMSAGHRRLVPGDLGG